MDVILAIDIGTTNTKSILYTSSNEIILSYSKSYPLLTNSEGAAEQDPEEIFQAVIACIKKITENIPLGYTLKGIVFSSAMHSLIGMDSQNQPLTPCITWADNRAYACLQKLVTNNLNKHFYKLTGTPIHPMSPFAKILWIRETQHSLFQQISKFIGIKEYCFYRLFNSYIIDQSIASATGIFNLHSKKWDEDILQFLKIREAQLSTIVESRTSIFLNNPFWVKELNISSNIPFVVGASDGTLANYGFFQSTNQKEMVTVGTSSALRTLVDSPLLAENGETFCYMLDDKHWIVGGASNNCGATINWLQNLLNLKHLSVPDFLSFAENSTPGARSLVCLPYLLGERAPLWSPDATGAFIGMTKNHTPADFIRSMLESIIYNLAEIYQSLLANQLTDFINLPISGGLAQSDFFCQLTADIFNLPVIRQSTVEMSAWGAACLGFETLGQKIHSKKDTGCKSFIPKNNSEYKDSYIRFQKFQQLIF